MTRTKKETSEALQWFLDGDRGVSSEAIVTAALGKYEKRNADWPHDVADLGRCLRMLNALPWAKEGLDILAAASSVWKALKDNWDHLEALMDEEVGIGWSKGRSAPHTYEAIRKVIDEATKKANDD